MAPIIPDPRKVKSFRTQAVFATWLAANHARETELWLKVHKKDSGVPTVTYAQALDVALCADAPIRSATEATVPADLRASIEANPRAREEDRRAGGDTGAR